MKPRTTQRAFMIRGMVFVLSPLALIVACSDARDTATAPSLEWEHIWLGTGPGSGTPGEDWPEFCEVLFEEQLIDECDFMMTSTRDSLLSVFDDTTFFRSDDLNCADLKAAISNLMGFNDRRARGTGGPWAAVPVDPQTSEATGIWVADDLKSAPADTIRITMGHESYHVKYPEDANDDNAEAAGRYCFQYTDSVPDAWGPI